MSNKLEHKLFNETYAVDVSLSAKWSVWMNENYIPKALDSGLFESYIFSEVDNGVTEGAKSFALQFIVKNKEHIDTFISKHDPPLKQELNRTFAGSYASFVTILNIISK